MGKSNFRRSTAELGLSKRGGRANTFHIQLFTDDHGFQIYALENKAEGRKIFVPRLVFGGFRACIKMIENIELSKKKPAVFEYPVSFLNKDYFFFKSSTADLDNLIIQDIEEREGSSGYITVSRRALPALAKLLYSDRLQHPNDVLEEIISYHKLFQFSFVKGSKSISSALIVRKDVLQKTERYTPSPAQKVILDTDLEDEDRLIGTRPELDKSESITGAETSLYGQKLGARHNEKNIKVDYEEVFGGKKTNLHAVADDEEAKENKVSKGKAKLSQFPIPLAASEVKLFEDGKFHFELNTEEASEFRSRFINDRSAEFYMGFEIVDALFTYNKTIKTFSFPLYYTKVRIREAGRRVYLESRQNGRFYLNHIALANLVDKYSDTGTSVDDIDKFFKTLLAQDISVDRINDRICLSRYLPIKESIFDRTREILFGYQDENGKGGILADLTVDGIEVDMQSVYLYRAPKLLNPIDQALEFDLDRITTIAHHSTKRFYNSLLGEFLVPEQKSEEHRKEEFAPQVWMPGKMPRSTRSLMEGLSSHDLVLLEGPPGTGKTHTIMNLLIHCVNTNQRVLVVSDQQAAIEALVEKFQEYLVGEDKGTPAERKWKELLYSAIKVVDEVETGDQSLADLVGKLSRTFNAHELTPGSANNGSKLERRMKTLNEKIEKLTLQITSKMIHHMGEEAPFDQRVLKKDEVSTNNHHLLEFLDLIRGEKLPHKPLIDAFVRNRFELIQGDMGDCYHFFKIPSKSFSSEVQTLKDDGEILSRILAGKVRTVEDFHQLTKDYPRHELIRYLETIIKAQTSTAGNSVVRLARKMRALVRSPLLRTTRKLLNMVQDQASLLKLADNWSEELWQLLRGMHESIRIGEAPNIALGMFRSLDRQAGIDIGSSMAKSASIHGDLEEIADLYVQHDKIVRQRLVENLRGIVHSATASKSGSGTNKITSIMSLADSLKQFDSISESGGVFEELTESLYEAFPIWIARKQVIPFLLPCEERSFDLVIIDEATQCRVDDSLSLMFRAKKILVVGDDKQTVLQKDSVIDDYLFKDHELDEHLRSTQARGFKGGGSNIFALVKSIKQASVMLDEHYRCPAEIIEFSNKYVYDNELKIMQWSLPEHESCVAVNYGEQKIELSKRPTSGKFKGIDTAMIDRFMDYVVRSLKKIEKTTGKKIDVETDVALCYFLLKNEPYVKAIKDSYLRKLNRGEDILDGAGAALQGKERDYIFYLWDVNRYNMGAFKQGDDADKRKGELNVLLSRPKKKAFHYLSHDFEEVEHGRTDITRYLWQAYHRQQGSNNVESIDTRGNALRDSLLGSLLRFTLDKSSQRGIKEVRQNMREASLDFREDIVVGDAGRVVDLIAFPAGEAKQVVGLVDLSGFGCEHTAGENIVDYFFQLKRASPGIDPVFIFPQELIDENGQTFRSLMSKLEHLNITKANRQAAKEAEVASRKEESTTVTQLEDWSKRAQEKSSSLEV
jgi:hypothetical protein